VGWGWEVEEEERAIVGRAGKKMDWEREKK
jgi:hypothetical protein